MHPYTSELNALAEELEGWVAAGMPGGGAGPCPVTAPMVEAVVEGACKAPGAPTAQSVGAPRGKAVQVVVDNMC